MHTEYAKAQGIAFKRSGTGWLYEWDGNGMLKKVINPGGREIEFYYDPLGRRIAKIVLDQNARFLRKATALLPAGYGTAMCRCMNGNMKAPILLKKRLTTKALKKKKSR